MRGRTSLVIAHRLSTLENCDIRLTVDHGHVTAEDGHAGKLRPGWYARSLLVYGNDGYEREAAGCLRWHWL